MEDTMNRIMVKTIVKKAIRDIKTDPERTTRNLIGMVLNFADSRFQKGGDNPMAESDVKCRHDAVAPKDRAAPRIACLTELPRYLLYKIRFFRKRKAPVEISQRVLIIFTPAAG